MNKNAKVKLGIIIFLFLVGIFCAYFVLAGDEEILDPIWEGVGIETKIDIENRTYIDNLRTSDSIIIKDKLTKVYNATKRELKLTDENSVIIDIKLTSKYKELVGRGEDVKVAEFNLNDFGSLDKIFDSINSYEIDKNYAKKEKEYWFKYGIDYIVKECHNLSEFEPDIKEDGIFCQNVTKTNWTRFNLLDELPNKNIKIGLFTNTIGEKKVEWVPNIKGFEVLEWAEYEIVG